MFTLRSLCVRLSLGVASVAFTGPQQGGMGGGDETFANHLDADSIPHQAFVKQWSLHNIQIKHIKIGARLVRHDRRLVFEISEVAMPREVFRRVLERSGGLDPAPG